MECFCGCGRILSRDQRELGLQAGVLALELLAWDKARMLWRSDPDRPRPAGDVNRLISEGADIYQRIVRQMHGDDSVLDLREGEEWLRKAEAARISTPSMTKASWLTRTRTEPQLDEYDVTRLDRVHPELSYSGRGKAESEAG